jgi:hypothetical protein
VLEADLDDPHDADDLILRAREAGAELVWIHSNADLAAHGFERFPGYVRMRAEHPPAGRPLPPLEPEHYARTLDGSYRGLWGHKLVREDPRPPANTVVLGLHGESGEPTGLCIVDPAERLVDGPGVLPHARVPDAYERLLLGACAELGPGPIELDSWGDAPAVIDAYAALGFAIVERTAGWQLRLGGTTG